MRTLKKTFFRSQQSKWNESSMMMGVFGWYNLLGLYTERLNITEHVNSKFAITSSV